MAPITRAWSTATASALRASEVSIFLRIGNSKAIGFLAPRGGRARPEGPRRRLFAGVGERDEVPAQANPRLFVVLREVGSRLGWTISKVYRDDGISGARGRDHRPGFNDLMKAVIRREIDLVAAWDASRISRSMKDLVSFLVGLYLHQSGIDTTTLSGQALLQMLGVCSPNLSVP